MPPSARIERLTETKQIALIRAAAMVQHQQTSGITGCRPLLEGQGVHSDILLARLTNAASQDCTAAETAGKSAFRL